MTQEIIQLLQASLEESARIAREYFGHVSATVKSEDNNQVLTEADKSIAAQQIAFWRAARPDWNIIDEEMGIVDNSSAYTVVIDPIDGTSNFANGLPHYGVMVGILEGSKPVAGGIALPSFEKIYLGSRGKGAVCNGEPIFVSAETKLLNSLVAYGIDGHQEKPERTRQETSLLAEIVLVSRNIRSSNSAFDLVMTATGAYGAVLNQTSKIWDNVAPQAIIEAAGGKYTDFYGRPINYSDPISRITENYTMCAGAPLLHTELQQIIKGGAQT